MGKKKEKIEIKLSDEELVPSTIGLLEETKKSSAILIILFLIFILFALFLPNITEYVNKLLDKDPNVAVPNSGTKEEEDNNDGNNEVIMHDISDDLKINYNDIEFTNIKIYESNEKYYISLNLENLSKKQVNFGQEKYYLETYSEDKTLLARYIFNNLKLDVKEKTTQNLEISQEVYNNISKILIVEKNVEDYPKVSLKPNANKEYNLTCIKDSNIIVYNFDKDDNLMRIKDTINITNDYSESYSQKLSQYQIKAANLNNKNGISSSLIEISTGFTATTDITIKTADLSGINNDNYYSKANPTIIDFEMEARGYTCQ